MLHNKKERSYEWSLGHPACDIVPIGELTPTCFQLGKMALDSEEYPHTIKIHVA